MSKLTEGGKLPEFIYDTPFVSGLSIADTVKRAVGRTALVFLRYYGCTLCQYDIHQFAAQHDLIAATGGQMLVVLQSDPAKLAEQLTPGDLPFDIVCDPEQKLYKAFSIDPAPSMDKLADIKTMGKIAKATVGGFKHGDYEGDELQLPAVFVVTPDLTLTHVHYGAVIGDVPTPAGLAKLLA